MLLKEQYDVLVKSLLPYAQKKLGFNKPPRINFIEDEQNSKNPLGKTAFYSPQDKEITIFISNRHPKDILRSVAHELVHYKQDCDGRLTNNLKQDLHDANYTQNNEELRKFEEEAYLNGNMVFRDWEDNYKNGSKQIIKITKESKQMNESALKDYIRKMISEIISEEKKEKEEEQRVDVSKVRDSAKKEKLSQYKIAEEVENSTLNEWKNQELFGLLTKRFGILSEAKEMSAKDKKFAALAPPEDEITYADKIAGAKGNQGEEDEEEEELNEAEEKMTKPEIKQAHKIAKGIMKSQKGKEGDKLSKESAYKIGRTAKVQEKK